MRYMSHVKRNLLFIGTLIRMKLAHMMVFRLAFFGSFFVDGTMFIFQILMFSAIYGQTGSIGGWDRGTMLFFIGSYSLINALNMLIYFFGINGLAGKIRDGNLDHYLTKPVNPLLRITFESVDPGAIPLVLGSIAILCYAFPMLGVPLTFGRVFGYTFLMLLMVLLYYDMEVIWRTLPFFFLSVGSVERLEGELILLCMKLPGVFFKGLWKVVFYLILPYGIMATLPTQFFAGILSPQGYLYCIAVTVGFTAFTLAFWKLGLKHYKSPGS